jgi:hypothetical protein
MKFSLAFGKKSIKVKPIRNISKNYRVQEKGIFFNPLQYFLKYDAKVSNIALKKSNSLIILR